MLKFLFCFLFVSHANAVQFRVDPNGVRHIQINKLNGKRSHRFAFSIEGKPGKLFTFLNEDTSTVDSEIVEGCFVKQLKFNKEEFGFFSAELSNLIQNPLKLKCKNNISKDENYITWDIHQNEILIKAKTNFDTNSSLADDKFVYSTSVRYKSFVMGSPVVNEDKNEIVGVIVKFSVNGKNYIQIYNINNLCIFIKK